MKKTLRILRRGSAAEKAYWEDFPYETEDSAATAATALTDLNARGADIAWECSCLQKKCGACAMVINGVPRLACDTVLSELKGDVVTLEPLRKFPVVRDLQVDRSAMTGQLSQLNVWLEQEAEDTGEETAFAAASCLRCGLCLEVCPNFAPGETFAGMSGMTALARLMAAADREEMKRIAKDYRRGVYKGCGKSLACRDICPAGIDLEELLVRSNAAAVWRRQRAVKI